MKVVRLFSVIFVLVVFASLSFVSAQTYTFQATYLSPENANYHFFDDAGNLHRIKIENYLGGNSKIYYVNPSGNQELIETGSTVNIGGGLKGTKTVFYSNPTGVAKNGDLLVTFTKNYVYDDSLGNYNSVYNSKNINEYTFKVYRKLSGANSWTEDPYSYGGQKLGNYRTTPNDPCFPARNYLDSPSVTSNSPQVTIGGDGKVHIVFKYIDDEAKLSSGIESCRSKSQDLNPLLEENFKQKFEIGNYDNGQGFYYCTADSISSSVADCLLLDGKTLGVREGFFGFTKDIGPAMPSITIGSDNKPLIVYVNRYHAFSEVYSLKSVIPSKSGSTISIIKQNIADLGSGFCGYQCTAYDYDMPTGISLAIDSTETPTGFGGGTPVVSYNHPQYGYTSFVYYNGQKWINDFIKTSGFAKTVLPGWGQPSVSVDNTGKIFIAYADGNEIFKLAQISTSNGNQQISTIGSPLTTFPSAIKVYPGDIIYAAVQNVLFKSGTYTIPGQCPPGQPEVCTDLIDNDCNGLRDYADPACPAPQCTAQAGKKVVNPIAGSGDGKPDFYQGTGATYTVTTAAGCCAATDCYGANNGCFAQGGTLPLTGETLVCSTGNVWCQVGYKNDGTGKCVVDTTPQTCVDSDGNDPYTKGTVTSGGVTYTDSCQNGGLEVPQGTSLYEYVCNPARHVTFDCAASGTNGRTACYQGKCVDPSTIPNCNLNGDVEPYLGEVCDDGNTNNNDACSNSCQLNAPTQCIVNEGLDSGEICDPEEDPQTFGGNSCDSLGYDGGSLICSGDCSLNIEGCYVCGDNHIDPGETCDDGNGNNDDTCKNDCTLRIPTECVVNGALNNGEVCDPQPPQTFQPEDSCSSLGFDGGGNLACNNDCSLDTSDCSGDGGDDDCGNTYCEPNLDEDHISCPEDCIGTCVQDGGDGVKDAGEECDGTDIDGATCQLQGFDGGTPICNDDCTLNYGACYDNPEEFDDCSQFNNDPQACDAHADYTQISDELRDEIENSQDSSVNCVIPGELPSDICTEYYECECILDRSNNDCNNLARLTRQGTDIECGQDPNIGYSCETKLVGAVPKCVAGEKITLTWTAQVLDENDNPSDKIFSWCQPGSRQFPCPSSTRVPFFGLYSLLTSLAGIIIVYLFIGKRINKRKKN